MRTKTSDSLSIRINNEYKTSGMDVDSFIVEQTTKHGAFDIRYLEDAHGDRYASFHLVIKRRIVTVYYWESRDEWFCKY